MNVRNGGEADVGDPQEVARHEQGRATADLRAVEEGTFEGEGSSDHCAIARSITPVASTWSSLR